MLLPLRVKTVSNLEPALAIVFLGTHSAARVRQLGLLRTCLSEQTNSHRWQGLSLTQQQKRIYFTSHVPSPVC